MAIDTTSTGTTSMPHPPARAGTARHRHGRLRVHGRRPLPGLAQRPQLLRPAPGARPRRHRRAVTRAAAADMARRFDWQHVETDWRGLVARDDVDLVDICTPGDTHAEIAIAALEAGKHVLCEKPLANTVAEARGHGGGRRRGARRTASARWSASPTGGCRPSRSRASSCRRGASARSATCARSTCRTGSSTPRSPLTWRLDKERAGSGALGDIGAHIIDLDPLRHRRAAHGRQRDDRDLRRASGRCPARCTGCRPRSAPGAGRSPSTTRRSSSPGSAAGRSPTFEATRFATGRKNAIRLEINGSRGSIAFDFEDMNVLHVHDAQVAAPRVRVHRGSSSPSRPTPTSSTGGRPGTAWATSTASPTRPPTSSTRSPAATTQSRRSPTGSPCRRCSPPSSSAPPTVLLDPPRRRSPSTAPPRLRPPPAHPPHDPGATT